MKKTYKIEVDCANCANKMEDAARGTSGVKEVTVNFMTRKAVQTKLLRPLNRHRNLSVH